MTHFILLHHVSWPDLGLFPRNVSGCGCQRMIFGTHPHGHHLNVGASPRLCSQDDVSHQQGAVPLSLQQVNHLFEVSFVRDESSASNADVDVIPSLHRVTQQILRHWQPFVDLKLMFTDSLTVEMKPGLLVSVRLSLPWPWAPRSRSSMKRH